MQTNTMYRNFVMIFIPTNGVYYILTGSPGYFQSSECFLKLPLYMRTMSSFHFLILLALATKLFLCLLQPKWILWSFNCYGDQALQKYSTCYANITSTDKSHYHQEFTGTKLDQLHLYCNRPDTNKKHLLDISCYVTLVINIKEIFPYTTTTDWKFPSDQETYFLLMSKQMLHQQFHQNFITLQPDISNNNVKWSRHILTCGVLQILSSYFQITLKKNIISDVSTPFFVHIY